MLAVTRSEAQNLSVDRVAEHFLHIGPGLVGRGCGELLRDHPHGDADSCGNEKANGTLPVRGSTLERRDKIREEKDRRDPEKKRRPLDEDILDNVFFLFSQKLEKPGSDHAVSLPIRKITARRRQPAPNRPAPGSSAAAGHLFIIIINLSLIYQ